MNRVDQVKELIRVQKYIMATAMRYRTMYNQMNDPDSHMTECQRELIVVLDGLTEYLENTLHNVINLGRAS